MNAPYVLEYAYKRSTGPIVGAFLTALRSRRILGARTSNGRVICPATEYDPATGEDVVDLVEVGPGGVVETWHDGWALIRPDGADTAMLHRLEASEPRAGLRVFPRWRAETRGHISDIEAWTPEPTAPCADPSPDAEPITRFKSPVRLDYVVAPGQGLGRSLAALMDGRILGGRCGACTKVYVPLRGVCPTCGAPFGEEVTLSDTGTLTTFCVVNIAFEGQALKPPFVAGAILLDGADVPLFHLVGGVDPAEVRMGLRLRARWRKDPMASLETIEFFEPTGEPDAPFESYEEHL